MAGETASCTIAILSSIKPYLCQLECYAVWDEAVLQSCDVFCAFRSNYISLKINLTLLMLLRL